jgi:glycosyltransferase involved in cell wall biosynthesis
VTTVSIAMATYNGARFLDEQLASFAAQTRLPDELVVTDDGSTDGTIQVLERFATSSPFPVRIERNREKLGLHRNFEKALSLATGDVVLVSDQDDIWYPNKVETVVVALEKRPDMLALHHDEHILDQDTGELLDGTLAERTAHLGGWDRMLAAGNCTALRREVLAILLPLPENVFYDEWINWVPDLLGGRLVLREPLQLWRRHGANESLPTVAVNRPSRLDVYRRFGTVDPRPGWSDYRRRLALVRERISEHAAGIDRLLGVGRAARAIRIATEEIEALDARIALVGRPKTIRWASALRLWMQGFYEPYSGWRSALKDSVVP